MLRFSIFFVAVLFSTLLLAQEKWEAPLSAQLELLSGEPSAETLAQGGSVIERIALAHPDAWLPSYYAARIQQIRHYMAGEEGCTSCIEAMDVHLERAEASDNNSEVMTLRASYYQTMLGLYPMRAPYYGPKAGNLLERAVNADRSNPRAASLLGQNYYYTPAMFGGGVDIAQPILDRAVKLFEIESKTERGLLPTWGAERAQTMAAQALAATE